MIQAVIFDCFGVLVGKGFEYTYRLAGGDPVADKPFIDDTLGKANLGLMSIAEFDAALCKQLNLTEQQWLAICEEAEQPDKVLLDYIVSIRGRYTTAVLSNANKGTLEAVLGTDTLARCFDEIIVSAEVGYAKPDPRIYEHATTQIGVEPAACIFIDDQPGFLPPAEALGIHTIQYLDQEQVLADLDQLLN
jgi:epoxide hydrolase-like predicted phosphatase